MVRERPNTWSREPRCAELTRRVPRARRSGSGQGGGAARVAKMHQQGKLAPRERVAKLLRPRCALARDRPARRVRPVRRPGARRRRRHRRRRGGRAGRWSSSPTTRRSRPARGGRRPSRKILRAQEIAMRQRIPIIYLVDCAGVNLPYQGGVFPGQYGAARIFYYNSIMRRYLHVPQIAAVMGQCIAGGAYLPALSDVIFMVEGHVLHGTRRAESGEGRHRPDDRRGDAGRRGDAHRGQRAWRTTAAANDAECLARIREYVGRAAAGRRRAAPALPARRWRPPARRPTLYDLLPRTIACPTTCARARVPCSTTARSTSSSRASRAR